MGISNINWDKTRALRGDSRVFLDGREKLGKSDWKRRVAELQTRSNGYCEHRPDGITRCFGQAIDPHHIIKRSKERDDRLTNLLHVCRQCHILLDNRKTSFGEGKC